MSKRLNQKREKEISPQRMAFAEKEIIGLGLPIEHKDENVIKFRFKGNLISFWPYSGWFSGKGVQSGRGWSSLYDKIKPQ